MKPNFLYIGPDKSGSSWMYQVLNCHPQCYVPDCKDIYFFDRHYAKGFDWYLSFFENVPDDVQAAGELSHDYLFSALAAERIALNLPDVKLITCLRDPVERTFSQYLYMISSGWTNKSFEDALKDYPILINNSLYAKHLEPYFNSFDRSCMKILLFENLKKNPAFLSAIEHIFIKRESKKLRGLLAGLTFLL